MSGRRVAHAVKSLVNAKDLQLECARVLHEKYLVPVLMYEVRQCYGKRRKDIDCMKHCLCLLLYME